MTTTRVTLPRDRVESADISLTRAAMRLGDTQNRLVRTIDHHARRPALMRGAELSAILRDFKDDVLAARASVLAALESIRPQRGE